MTQKSRKPYTLVGAEQLTGSVYKIGDELTGFEYRFNITRLSNRTGRVIQWFTPDDLFPMVKLVRVLSAELTHDGCIAPAHSHQLNALAAALDEAIAAVAPNNTSSGASNS